MTKLLVLLVVAACSPASTPRSIANAAAAPTLVLANLSFLARDQPVRLYTLSAEGELRSGPILVGTVGTDGSVVFIEPKIRARLDANGHFVITGPTDLDPEDDLLPGDLAKQLHDHQGTVRSTLALRADGTAASPGKPAIAIGADHTIGHLRVEGMTADTRRTAMFVYILMQTIGG